jgi:multidrug efflux system outer membrane protein
MRILLVLNLIISKRQFVMPAAAAVSLALLAAGCAAGPNYKAPATSGPAAFSGGAQTNLQVGNPEVLWWKGFKDGQLDKLVESALARNHDLKIASANVHEARALRRFAQFDLLPVPNATAGYTHSVDSTAVEPGFSRSQRELQLYDAGFDATWELDFFGRVRRSIQSATAGLEAVEAVRRDVEITLISEVARNYLELRGLQNQLDVAKHNAENQGQTLKLTQALLDGGRGTELDVARARAQLNTTMADIPPLQTAISRAIHRLSVLTGRQPSDLEGELAPAAPPPALPPLVAIGNPEAMLRRRPDIRAAERSLAATTAGIGVVTADLFPRVTFNGSVAFQATSISGLGNAGSDAWSFGPRITWAALDLGHVRARIKAADARTDAALASYEKTVLTALEETENALVDFGNEQTRRDYLYESVAANTIAARLARERYENGITDFLAVLDAERNLFIAQELLAFSQTRTATSLVAVYKALGGGWENDANGASDQTKR